MVGTTTHDSPPVPSIIALGDASLLVRFDTTLTDAANRAAIALAGVLAEEPIAQVREVVPSLVSVLLRYYPMTGSPAAIAGEVRLRLIRLARAEQRRQAAQVIAVRFGGEDGPDLAEVAALLGLTEAAFIAAHNASPLRVLSTGFAPGFLYCGLHPETLILPRRTSVRPSVPKGSVLFAAGQTAMTATDMPTGWHVIGRTNFANFDPAATPPTQLRAGDTIMFEPL